MSVGEDRHPSVIAVLRYFDYAHLPPELQLISAPCAELAERMVRALPDDPMLTIGLHKLLEAKDCFVRAGIE